MIYLWLYEIVAISFGGIKPTKMLTYLTRWDIA